MSSGSEATTVDASNAESITEQKLRRFRFTDDGLAWVILLSLIVYVGLSGYNGIDYTLGGVNPAVLGVYITIVGIATTWVFGRQAVKVWRSGDGTD